MKKFIGTAVLLLVMMLCCEVGAVTVEYENCLNHRQTDFRRLLFETTPENFHHPGYEGIALNCRVTCRNCATYHCRNPKSENVLPCTALSAQCNHPTLGLFMRKNCPATYGTCELKDGQECKDVASAVICFALKMSCGILCFDSFYEETASFVDVVTHLNASIYSTKIYLRRISKEIRRTNMKELIGRAIVLFILLLRYEVGALDVESESCKDQSKKTEFCKLLFERTPQNCHDPGYRTPALNCRVSCDNCAAFNCHNPLPNDVVPCDALEPQCTDPTMGPIVRKNCPATCGTCDTIDGQTCQDVASPATCAALKALCDSHENYEFMTQQCPATCGRCPSTGQCEDTIPNCRDYLTLCNDTRYDDLMRQKCGKTCNKCNSLSVPRIGPSGSCVDKPRCATWVSNGFCSNSGYSEEVKREYCPRSCNLC